MGNENSGMESSDDEVGAENLPNQQAQGPNEPAPPNPNAIQRMYNAARTMVTGNSEESNRQASTETVNNPDPPSKYARRYNDDDKAEALRLLADGMSTRGIATHMGNGLSYASVSRWQVEHRQNRIRELRERRRRRQLRREARRREAQREATRQAEEATRREILETVSRYMMRNQEADNNDDGDGAADSD